MPKFKVNVRETQYHLFLVEAENEEAAREIALEKPPAAANNSECHYYDVEDVEEFNE